MDHFSRAEFKRFDPSYDCRTDSNGKDPDAQSPTLRRYHQLLWSKPLPNDRLFHLDISGPKPFLVHRSDLGEFHLTSDSITHSYSNRLAIKEFIAELPSSERDFAASGAWLISECIVFPGRRIAGQNTINGARGMSRSIGDRFDLTLECIRRHYCHEESPLSQVLNRYQDFFALFQDFAGYVEFFHLQDLVDEQCKCVRFFLPFDNFVSSPYPETISAYATYIHAVGTFAKSRTRRIVQWIDAQCR